MRMLIRIRTLQAVPVIGILHLVSIVDVEKARRKGRCASRVLGARPPLLSYPGRRLSTRVCHVLRFVTVTVL